MPHVLVRRDRRSGGRPRAPARSGASRPRESPRCAAATGRARRPSIAIVDAVPITMQVPAERDRHGSASMKACSVIMPALTSSLNFQTWLTPMSCPRYLPFSIGPPETTIAGRSQLAAPITSDGVVLSQPQSRTTPSIGVAADRLLDVHARRDCGTASRSGACSVSPVEVTGNSNGRPPASQTPRLTCSAICRRCALHGVSSDQVLQMPMTGRPSKTSRGRPAAQPAAMDEPVLVALAEPGARPERPRLPL